MPKQDNLTPFTSIPFTVDLVKKTVKTGEIVHTDGVIDIEAFKPAMKKISDRMEKDKTSTRVDWLK